MRLNTGFGLSVMFTRHRLSPANKTRLPSCHGDSRVFPAAGGVISSHSSKHYNRRYCAYQSWHRQNEYYENGAYKLCVEATRSLRWVATQQRHDNADDKQKVRCQQQHTHNPFTGTHLPPGPTDAIGRPAEH